MQLSIFCWKRHGSNTNSVAGYDKELLLSLSEGFCFCHHLFTGLRCMLLKSHKMYLISKLWNFLSRCVLTFWAVTNFGCADVTIFKVQGTCNQCYFQPKCREVKINWNFCIFSPSQVEFCSALFMVLKENLHHRVPHHRQCLQNLIVVPQSYTGPQNISLPHFPFHPLWN